MRNPIRRNRNIGTAKQGYGKSNKFRIPTVCTTSKSFFERLDQYTKVERIINDHQFIFVVERGHHFTYEPEYVRNTQLYRTLAHEFGHYVHYLDVVERPGTGDETSEEWEKRQEVYWKIPKAAKERFAHSYADRLLQQLKSDGLVPFERL